MGGGLFGTPLYLNPKCLAFAAFILGVYWMPHPREYTHKIVVNVILASAAYVLMAWYDVLYDCNDRFKPTLLGWLWKWAKPEGYQQEYENLPLKYKKIIRTFDIIILLILIALLMYPYIAYRR